jgi:DivIVA domain-containing protein
LRIFVRVAGMHPLGWIVIVIAVVGVVLWSAGRTRPESSPSGQATARPLVTDFTVVLRGYDMAQVDALVARSAATEPQAKTSLRADIESFLSAPTLALRGYDREQVGQYFNRLLADPGME